MNRSTYGYPDRRRAPTRRAAFHLDAAVLNELRSEAKRLGRSLSWVAQQAFRLARAELKRLPAPPGGGRTG